MPLSPRLLLIRLLLLLPLPLSCGCRAVLCCAAELPILDSQNERRQRTEQNGRGEEKRAVRAPAAAAAPPHRAAAFAFRVQSCRVSFRFVSLRFVAVSMRCDVLSCHQITPHLSSAHHLTSQQYSRAHDAQPQPDATFLLSFSSLLFFRFSGYFRRHSGRAAPVHIRYSSGVDWSVV